jgi:hypothetical protein
MATALVLTPQAPTASVLIQITGAPAGPVVITRTDANGTNLVRLRVGQAPIAGALTITDYEPALVGVLTYDVVDSALVTTTSSTTLAGLVSSPQITGVQLPGLDFQPQLITGYTAGREASSTVHDIVGRGDPVVVLGPTRTRKGRVEVWVADYAEGMDLIAVLAQARILMLRQPDHPGMDMYFLATSIPIEPLQKTAQGWRWSVEFDFVELRSPALPLLGAAGWTFDDVASGYASFASVRAVFADFDELLVGV